MEKVSEGASRQAGFPELLQRGDPHAPVCRRGPRERTGQLAGHWRGTEFDPFTVITKLTCGTTVCLRIIEEQRAFMCSRIARAAPNVTTTAWSVWSKNLSGNGRISQLAALSIGVRSTAHAATTSPILSSSISSKLCPSTPGAPLLARASL